ncbi:putative hydrocarbon oxygenase MocD [Candidatus Rhodobacter oscarellae]|uniref:Putative hydrocarbon oxygenase MocD n=1 Tax=Candidatus Rhodobacter oscarellae TaxID=1675527 RepID=A0A0J9E8P7_9RHOB|nr:fatty acid desaturase family protein [Candidatus Rhodobacter lobularis]KMW59145.1 putative hydrocarbon oxygenase MocD [Candidatus Rhodobacter lobularis]
MTERDYNLLGETGRRAVETGLASAEWYHTDIPRKEMKALMRRSDQPAIANTALYYGLMVVFAGIGVALWPSWWSAPFWLAYGALYGSGSDARWHEAGHGTMFKTAWMNDLVYQVACFMIVRNPETWRWSHFRHHTDTIIVGRDPEIALMRPPAMARAVLNVVGLPDMHAGLARMLLNASGRLAPEELTFVPEAEQPKVVRVARIWVAIYAATLLVAILTWSILPLMVIGLPRLYGAWHFIMTGYLQHGGLADNVLDHRLNTRTVYMNPISRFLYLNMNYHIEHHMFPMVPYHRLPELHARIKDDLPAPSPSILHAYAEMLPVIWRQFRGEEVYLRRKLPSGARPYREDLHAAALGQPAE